MFNLLASFAEFWDDWGGICILGLIIALTLAAIVVLTILFVRSAKKAKREAQLNKEKVDNRMRINMDEVKTVEVSEEKAKKSKKKNKKKEEAEPVIEEEVVEVAEEVVVEQAIEVAPTIAIKEVVEDDEETLENSEEEGSASYHVPFVDKIEAADESIKEFFKALDEKLTSYKKVHGRISQKCASYRVGRELKAKISLRGKTLKLHLALDVDAFNEKIYFQKDYKDIKAYEEVPFTVKVKSERGLKNAFKLIEALLADLKPAKK